MDMRIPHIEIKIMLKSDPLKSRILVRRLAVETPSFSGAASSNEAHKRRVMSMSCVYVYMCICVYVYMCICVYVYMCIRLWSCICVYEQGWSRWPRRLLRTLNIPARGRVDPGARGLRRREPQRGRHLLLLYKQQHIVLFQTNKHTLNCYAFNRTTALNLST